MADTELLPCPFCGGTDTFVERADYSSAFVVCDSRVDEHSVCMARGPIAVQDDDGEEIPGGAGATAAWNRRAALASRPAEVDDEGLPAVLFDGHAVYSEITRKLGKAHCHSHEAVSATLDAVVRLVRAAPAERAQ